LALVACGSKDDVMSPPDAARWLQKACGITFAQDPAVLSGTASGPVSATVSIPAAEMEAVLAALRNDASLHSRGQSETRFSYESYPGDGPERACELDTTMRVLYFRYAEAAP
jgi:hypothetical protein